MYNKFKSSLAYVKHSLNKILGLLFQKVIDSMKKLKVSRGLILAVFKCGKAQGCELMHFILTLQTRSSVEKIWPKQLLKI